MGWVRPRSWQATAAGGARLLHGYVPTLAFARLQALSPRRSQVRRRCAVLPFCDFAPYQARAARACVLQSV
eukprot:12808352-Alexandrium_andersonii.AAC.1